MIIRSVDSENDWNLGKGASDYARNQQAVEQNIKSRLLSWVGDCFFALQEGVDWKSRLDTGQQAELLDDIRSVILRSFGVVGINSVSFTFDGGLRLFSLSFDVVTIFSQSFQQTIEQAAGVETNA